jgi:hypothetical protein
MDDTSIQFRLRLAQINGIKLDEAEQEFGRKPFKAGHVAQHIDDEGNKHTLSTRSDSGDKVYYSKTFANGKTGNSHKGMSPIYSSKEKAMADFNKHVTNMQEAQDASRTIDRQFEYNLKKERASVLGMYHSKMAKYLSRGDSSDEAHERATADVAGEHGLSGLEHLDHHYETMTGSKAPG